MSRELLSELKKMQIDLELEDKYFKATTLRALEIILLKLITIQNSLLRLEDELAESSAKYDAAEILMGQEL